MISADIKQRWRRLGQHGLVMPHRPFYAGVVLHRPRCRCAHVRRTERRQRSAAQSDDLGHGVEWRPGCHNAHHLLVSDSVSALKCMNSRNISFAITDLEGLLNNDSLVPIIGVIQSSTGSHAATCVLGTVLLVLIFFSTVTTIASASRQIWAFSRDQGFPFSEWIRYVPPTYEIPVNAVFPMPFSSSEMILIGSSSLSHSVLAWSYPPSTLALMQLSMQSSVCPTLRLPSLTSCLSAASASRD